MKKRVAAVTMVYNEKKKLPRWIRHYSSQVNGAENLYVVDHGSNDGSTQNIGPVNVISLDRSAGEGRYQEWRVGFASDLCAKLLEEYDAVFYTDADELVIAHPSRYRSLYEYVAEGSPSNTAIGFDVIHDIETEGPLDDRFIFEQRSKLQFVAAMCKPVFVNQPRTWAPGFHCSTTKPAFGDLLLFHLRYVDLYEGLERLQVTRTIDRPDMKGNFTDHHKLTDDTFSSWIKNWSSLPVEEGSIALSSPIISSYIEKFAHKPDANGIYRFDYSYRSDRLFKAPSYLKFIV